MSATAIQAVDLFCGAGGTSTGLIQAAQSLKRGIKLVAVNHWQLAIDTHSRNHSYAEQICKPVEEVKPQEIGLGKIDLLIAAPECLHFSTARGGRPMCDQSRSQPWLVLEWIEKTRPSRVLIENVPEFVGWGPLSDAGRPLKSKKGAFFLAWIAAIRAANYRVEWRILNCADFGDPTTRRRLFIMARKGNGRIHWPEPTHCRQPKRELFSQRERWVPAREIIDWSLKGNSIFRRKRPLASATIRRIMAGLQKFGGPNAEPFLVILRGMSKVRSVDDPVPTISTSPGNFGLVEPFLVDVNHADSGGFRAYAVSQPLGTVTAQNGKGLVQPFIVAMNHLKSPGHDQRYTKSVDEPLPTVTGRGNRFYLCEPVARPDDVPKAEPFLIAIDHRSSENAEQSADAPLSTVTAKGRHALVEPFIVYLRSDRDGKPIDGPLPTITTKPGLALCQPFIVPQFGEREGQSPRVHAVQAPLPAVTSHGAGALVEPVLVKYYGGDGRPESQAQSVDEPLSTVTSKARFGLVQCRIACELDILFRMLEPHELAAAMSFPKSYVFKGSKANKVRQIGNAVPVKTAKALCEALLGS